ncbi:hypothetical protein N5E99_11080 [Pseudomonas chengduensis]|jgi:hypothetical protein|uniref:Uncharacterized protein n=1 Tax=Ectopseudomonas chengduensis TaxID=489632 RepID=A0A1G6S3X3_9GAMM|nr:MULTISPECIES: hypothetical protein [Pseudomonas]KQO44223.1 hypothetical protein ASF15_02940 [Pseudomonas sp. Leaf83]MBP3063480.1 hypothetical protein [Pseudomonas chengduensis]MDH1536294.1 hypothetical protein [Pseudomonas chengduensis]NNB76246.1 hypothetical protein [Pseudomonas chengduensis]SDD11374.1 hypothetical protein SAMN05216576_11112 [Pseudomonas chengduensis]
MDSLIAWAAWLEATALGEQMRSSALLYPAVNLLHLLGLVLLLGPMLLLDARLLGAGRSFPLAAVSRTLTPLAVAGLLLLLGSGVCLFAADAGPLAVDRLLQLKLLLIALGIGNALLFRRLWNARLGDWDTYAPLFGRMQAALSLLIWLLVMSLGRLLAYF